jgi:hypothetical protein
VNFNYFVSDEVAQYIMDAVDAVAKCGAAMLPYYRFTPENGLWVHRDGTTNPPMSIRDVAYTAEGMQYPDHRQNTGTRTLADFMAESLALIERAETAGVRDPLPAPDTTEDFEHLRWFPYPAEVASG